MFCKALGALSTYQPLRDSALPWLYTIAAHRLADHYRSQRPVASLEVAGSVSDGRPTPADVAVSRDLVRQVWDAAERLPDSQRQALWLRFGEDREYTEIANSLGRSVEAVKLLVHRGAKSVRMRMQLAERPARTVAGVAAVAGGGRAGGLVGLA